MVLAVLLCCCQGGKDATKYILVIPVKAYPSQGSDTVVEKIESDTVAVPSVLAAYSKGIQKYAAVLMHVAQFPDSIAGVQGLRILDNDGKDVAATVPQHQRDSIIMDFIQFARSSDIPYYERVKDFELKLMNARQ